MNSKCPSFSNQLTQNLNVNLFNFKIYFYLEMEKRDTGSDDERHPIGIGRSVDGHWPPHLPGQLQRQRCRSLPIERHLGRQVLAHRCHFSLYSIFSNFKNFKIRKK